MSQYGDHGSLLQSASKYVYLWKKIADLVDLDGEGKELYYLKKHASFKREFQRMFFVNEEHGWYDYNLRTKSHNIVNSFDVLIALIDSCLGLLHM